MTEAQRNAYAQARETLIAGRDRLKADIAQTEHDLDRMASELASIESGLSAIEEVLS